MVSVVLKNNGLMNVINHWAYVVDIFLVFVVIPFTYVLNREITKQIIIIDNWYEGIRSVFCGKNLPTPVVDPPPQRHPQPIYPSNSLKGIRTLFGRKVVPISLRAPSNNQNPTTPPGISAPLQERALTLHTSNCHKRLKRKIDDPPSQPALKWIPRSNLLGGRKRNIDIKVTPIPLLNPPNAQHPVPTSRGFSPPQYFTTTLNMSNIQHRFRRRIVDSLRQPPPQPLPQSNPLGEMKRVTGRNVVPIAPHEPLDNPNLDPESGVVTPPQRPAITLNMSNLHQRFRSRMDDPQPQPPTQSTP